MMSQINRFTPILWSQELEPPSEYGIRGRSKSLLLREDRGDQSIYLQNRSRGDRCRLWLARLTECFWRNFSLKTEEFRITYCFSKNEFIVVPSRREFSWRDYVAMGMQIVLCLSVVPLIVMLAAKLIVRSHYQFTCSRREYTHGFAILEQCRNLDRFRVLCSQIDLSSQKNLSNLPDLLFKMMHRRLADTIQEETAFFKVLVEELIAAGRSDLLGAFDAKGLTLLHYAYLYHNQEAINLLEAQDKEGVLGQACSTEPFLLDFCIYWGREKQFPLLPKGLTPKQMAKRSDHLAAHQLLCEDMMHSVQIVGRGFRSQFCDSWMSPWKAHAVFNLERVWSYLDVTQLDSLDIYGKTLLHYVKLYRPVLGFSQYDGRQIEEKLIASGASRAIKSRDLSGVYACYKVCKDEEPIKMEDGLTADQFAASFWDQFYWRLARRMIRDNEDVISSTLFCEPWRTDWAYGKIKTTENIISEITTLDRRDQDGRTLMDYARLLGRKEMQKQLQARGREIFMNAIREDSEADLGLAHKLLDMGLDLVDQEAEKQDSRCVDKILEIGWIGRDSDFMQKISRIIAEYGGEESNDERSTMVEGIVDGRDRLKKRAITVVREPISGAVPLLLPELVTLISQYVGWESSPSTPSISGSC